MNQEQKAAAESPNGYIQIIAGPGTGKTVTMVARIIELIKRGIDPSRIVAMTFTKAAAKELKDRLAKETSGSVHIGTFHSIAIRMMRRYGEMQRLNMRILGDHDAIALCSDVAPPEIRPRRLLKLFELLKRSIPALKHELYMSQLRAKTDNYPDVSVADVMRFHRDYQDRKSEMNFYDFDDILETFNNFLQQSASSTVGRDVDAILIDEFQDTCLSQLEIAMKMASCCHNITVVGDPKQSIYSFRGAVPGVFEKMRDYDDVKVMPLSTNYRSTQAILDIAQRILKQQECTIPHSSAGGTKLDMPQLKAAMTQASVPVQIVQIERKEQEPSLIANHIRQLLDAGVRANDICVLSFSSRAFASLEPAFMIKNIKSRIVGGHHKLSSSKFVTIIDYIRVALDGSDSLAIMRSMNQPSRRIGAKTLERLAEDCCGVNGICLDKLRKATHVKGVSSYIEAVDTVFNILKSPVKETAESEPTDDGPRDGFTKENIVAAVNWLNTNLFPDVQCQPVLDAIDVIWEEFELSNSEGEELQFADFASYFVNVWGLSAMAESDNSANSDDNITCSTIHSAKGLEWPVVILVGIERWSFWRAASDDEDENEKRRLIFVALTRAKRYLSVVLNDQDDASFLNLTSSQKLSREFRKVDRPLIQAIQSSVKYDLKIPVEPQPKAEQKDEFVGFRSGLEIYREETENQMANTKKRTISETEGFKPNPKAKKGYLNQSRLGSFFRGKS